MVVDPLFIVLTDLSIEIVENDAWIARMCLNMHVLMITEDHTYNIKVQLRTCRLEKPRKKIILCLQDVKAYHDLLYQNETVKRIIVENWNPSTTICRKKNLSLINHKEVIINGPSHLHKDYGTKYGRFPFISLHSSDQTPSD